MTSVLIVRNLGVRHTQGEHCGTHKQKRRMLAAEMAKRPEARRRTWSRLSSQPSEGAPSPGP